MHQEQGFTASERAIKKPKVEDIENAHQKLHSNMGDALGIDGVLNSKDAFSFLSKPTPQAEGEAFAQSVFDGQLARLGGVKGLANAAKLAEEEDQEAEKEKEKKADEKAEKAEGEGEDDIDADDDEAAASKKKRAKNAAPKAVVAKAWLNKDISIAAAVRGQVQWKADTRKGLIAVHQESLKLKLEIKNKNCVAALQPEIATCDARATAVGLILGFLAPLLAHNKQPESSTASCMAIAKAPVESSTVDGAQVHAMPPGPLGFISPPLNCGRLTPLLPPTDHPSPLPPTANISTMHSALVPSPPNCSPCGQCPLRAAHRVKGRV